MAMRLPITYLPRWRQAAYPLLKQTLLLGLRRVLLLCAVIAVVIAETVAPSSFRIGLVAAAVLAAIAAAWLVLIEIRQMLAVVSLRILTARRVHVCLAAFPGDLKVKGNQQ